MEIWVNVEDEIVISATEKAESVGLTIEQLIAAYLRRIADGSEPIDDEISMDGGPVRRTLRQQIYRMGV
jgi:antitoxin component of RelBE/YafQ-DinJ toxin-antitoxin module